MAALASPIRVPMQISTDLEQSRVPMQISTDLEQFKIIYRGGYVATPSREEQTFQTAGRYMQENFIVEEIPSVRVENEYSGITVIIAGR